MTFTYFVCYNALDINNNIFYGNCDMTMNHKIDCFDDIKDMISKIEIKLNENFLADEYTNVIIVNYTLLSVI